jgi:signal transduction histidine kinase
LTGLKLLLEVPKRFSREEILGKLEPARSLLTDLTAKVREMSLALRPAMLDDLGLLPALLWHFERYTDASKVQVRFEQSGLEGRRFALDLETAVYRIVQEALTNVTRHARTPEVTVRIQVRSESLDLQVEDKGVGFDPQAALAASTSVGLAGMRERAHLLGGHLTVESAPGAGTTVEAELPLGGEGAVERRSVKRET